MQPTPAQKPQPRLGRTAAALAWLGAAGATIVVLLLAASAAEGGTYRASLCNRHLGGAHGGLDFERNSDHYASTADCAAGGGLTIRHTARRTNRERWGSWSLAAPAGAAITRLRTAAGGTASAGHVPELMIGLPGEAPAPFGRIGPTVHSSKWGGTGAESFEARLRCARARGCGEGADAKLVLRRVDLRLSDTGDPHAALAGALAGPQTRRGVQTLETAVTDTGAGVRRVFLEVNGKPLAARRIPCSLVRRIATRLQPCAASAEPSFELDTAGRGFRQGMNAIRICADDFALAGLRNRTCARHRVRIDNECPVDDVNVARALHAHLVAPRRGKSIAHGQPARIEGRLVGEGGDGVAGAQVCVATRVALRGSGEHVVATPTTDGDGRFGVRIAPGPNREVRVAHWSGPDSVEERLMGLRVRAHPAFRVSPHHTLRNGQRVHFAVRLHGPAQSRRRIQIEAGTGHRWTVIRSKRTDSAGRWSGTYRFQATTGLRTYRFRAVVSRQQGYPYERGRSDVRTVRVRG